MKWTITRGRDHREFKHSYYSIKVTRIQPKGTYAVEFFMHDNLRFQRICKGLKGIIAVVKMCKSHIKKGV